MYEELDETRRLLWNWGIVENKTGLRRITEADRTSSDQGTVLKHSSETVTMTEDSEIIQI
jgi:hypothetical protein